MALRTSNVRPLTIVLIGVVFAFGCNSDSPPDDSRKISPDSSRQNDSLTQTLASRYLRYSYQGASLRSTHPLNDSLFALKTGGGSGGPVILVDTFFVEPAAMSHQDSLRLVRVEVPHAAQVSKSWKLSDIRSSRTFAIRIQNRKIFQSPRLVGWPALERHIRRVEPDSGAVIVKRLQKQWTNLTERGSAL